MDQAAPQDASGATRPDIAPSGSFIIPAQGALHESRPFTLKHGDTFAVFDHVGDSVARPGSTQGIFHCDTRYLSVLELAIAGHRPMLLSSTLRDDNATLTCDLSNPDIHGGDGALLLPHDLIHIRRTRLLWDAGSFERILVRNYDAQARTVTLAIGFDADFADLFEVRGTARRARGTIEPADVRFDRVTLSYTGLDRRRRTTLVRFDPAPVALDRQTARFTLTLAPQEARSLFMTVQCEPGAARDTPSRDFFIALRRARRALRQSSSRAAAIASSNEIFNEAARRSVADLAMLITDTDQGAYPYAGIPWFSTVFGRDALIVAIQTLWLDPSIARGVLCYLAKHQATTVDAAADAEPGKILHEVRHGEMAELGEVPFRRYYGSIDSTPLFLMLAGAYLRRTGDLETLRGLWKNFQAALAWIDDYGDRDGDGFVEYGRQNDKGLVNQGWKDSQDSIFHQDGTIASGPIALVEVQAYVYGAWIAAAEIAERLDLAAEAARLRERAAGLRDAFDTAFFDAALGTYVIALDGEKRPCRIAASNAGHALLTGIAYKERAAPVVATLLSAASFCGWGIRTLASGQARFNPMSYHNGSVWPHDNSLIMAGLSRYGFHREAALIFEGIFAAASYIDLRRLPELICGFPRQRGQGPTFYPVACMPQAWAAAAPLLMLQASIGLSFQVERNTVTFDRPALPSFLDALTVSNLKVGAGQLDVALRRSERNCVVDVLHRSGDLRVVTTV
jgi:glycogen debranching enzyme